MKTYLWACMNGRLDIVKLLLEINDINFDHKNNNNYDHFIGHV